MLDGPLYALSSTYRTWMDSEELDALTTSETMLSKKDIKKIQHIKNWKRHVKPALPFRCADDASTKRGRGSGGLALHVREDKQGLFNCFLESVNSRYIFANAFHDIGVADFYVYVPPFSGEKDYYVNPRKMAVIEGIFRDLDKLMRHAKAIRYDFAFIGDGNGHFGEWLGDSDCNPMARRFWWPLIQTHDLKCLNKSQCYGVTTYQSKSRSTSRAIDDIVLINSNWSNNKKGLSLKVFPTSWAATTALSSSRCAASASHERRVSSASSGSRAAATACTSTTPTTRSRWCR